jgi:hypothetical protein
MAAGVGAGDDKCCMKAIVAALDKMEAPRDLLVSFVHAQVLS